MKILMIRFETSKILIEKNSNIKSFDKINIL